MPSAGSASTSSPFAAATASRDPNSPRCARADVEHHGDRRPGDPAQVGDVTDAARAVLEDEVTGRLVDAENRQRQADLVVERPGRGDRRRRTRHTAAIRSLVEVLPDEPVTPTTRQSARTAKHPAGEEAERPDRVVDHDRRAIDGPARRGRPPHHARNASLTCRWPSVCSPAMHDEQRPSEAPPESTTTGPVTSVAAARRRRARPPVSAAMSPTVMAITSAARDSRAIDARAPRRGRRTADRSRPRSPGPVRGPCRRSRRRRPGAAAAITSAIAARRSGSTTTSVAGRHTGEHGGQDLVQDPPTAGCRW